jgi:hypothetical protein
MSYPRSWTRERSHARTSVAALPLLCAVGVAHAGIGDLKGTKPGDLAFPGSSCS